jgi:hypothetical protein
MDPNDNALDYLVDDLDNLNLNENLPQKIPENDNISAIYSEHSFSSEEKSLMSDSNFPNQSDNDDVPESNISDISENSISVKETKKKVVEDTPIERARILTKINKRIKNGYTTKVKCTINTPLNILNDELIYQNGFIREKESIELYKSVINNGVMAIEFIAGVIPLDKFNINLNGFSDAWTLEENQMALELIVEELELKYGAAEMSPEMRLGISLFKTAYIVVKMNRLGGNIEQPKEKVKTTTKKGKAKGVLKPPSAAIRKKTNKK